ncbi:MAG: ABC-type branched-chain amino acid transport system, periplasmic component, Leucine, isoleucine [Proteobacteria bacterium]|nr:ABC-type branched-chain amino acid transport system, periplasmic component, Leucine, isoleucine [Pseudomonadota bacterium]
MKTNWLSTIALVGLLAGYSNAAEPIKLGVVVPLGDISGRQGANAMKLAVKEINRAGGVLGRPLELIIVDDEMNPEKGAAAIEKLATEDKVSVFLGGMSSSVHLAQIPLMKKYGKVTIWSGAASSKVERALKDQDWYFHLHPWDYQQGQSYIDGWIAIAQKNPRVKVGKWFFAYEDGAFGVATYRANTDLFPKDWTHKGADFKSAAAGGGGDYRVVLKRAREEKPDIFVWVGYEADAMPIMRQAQEAGYAPPIFLGSPPGWPSYFGKSQLSDNVSLYGMWTPAMKNVSQASKHFSEAYKAEFNEEVDNYLAPMKYSSIYIVAEGIKKAGSLDTQALIAALEQTKYESPLGETITFKPSKIIKHQGLHGQKILQWQKGALQVIWPFEYATAKFNYPYKH